jgi:hypothetical protein
MKNDHSIKCFYFWDILVVLLFVRMPFLSLKKIPTRAGGSFNVLSALLSIVIFLYR